jgi:hypothetical protein
MSRRRGRDAFDVRFLQRTTPVWRASVPTVHHVLVRATAAVLDCIHGINWKTCTTCSNPRVP